MGLRFAFALGCMFCLGLALHLIGEGRRAAYTDARFGTSISYPPDLFPIVQEIRGGVLLVGRNVSVELVAQRDPAVRSLDDVWKGLSATWGEERLSRRQDGDSMVVWGVTNERDFKARYWLSDGVLEGYQLSYMPAQRGYFEPILEEVAASFVPGQKRAIYARVEGLSR